MKSKRLWLIVSSLLVLLAIGGCSMFQHNSEKDKYKIEQDRMVKYLADNYEDVQKVEFKTFEKNNTTGIWSSNAIVNDKIQVTFSINNLGKSEEIGFGQHISQSQGKKLIKKDGSSEQEKKSIKVIYYGEDD